MIIEKLKNYLTPQERELNKNWLLSLVTSVKLQPGDFLDDLFMDQVGSVWQRIFLLKYQNKPFSIIKSFIPVILINENKEKFCNSNKSNLNLELKIDQEKSANRIKKNILLTWPTSEESQMLVLKQKTQVFVEKNYIFHENQVIRYEEEIIIPDKIEYED